MHVISYVYAVVYVGTATTGGAKDYDKQRKIE